MFALNKVIRCMLFVLWGMVSLHGTVHAQADRTPITIGEYRCLFSSILNETRRVWVHLPVSYRFSERLYPVLFRCDALSVPLFAAGVYDLSAHEVKENAPELILVSIENTDRQRDMYPVAFRNVKPGADQFLGFLEKELIPFIERNYRAAPYRILMGESNSALFAIYAFLRRPDLFGGYIASSPELFHCRPLISELSRQTLKEKTFHRKHLFLVYGEKDLPTVLDSVPGFADILTDINPGWLSWDVTVLPQKGHVPSESLRLGLKHIFAGYSAPQDIIEQGEDALAQYYLDYNKKMGFSFRPNSFSWYRLAQVFIQQKKLDQAINLLTGLISRDPADPAALGINMSLARLYTARGDNGKAIDCYENIIKIQPAMKGFLETKIAKIRQADPQAQE